MTAGQLEAIEAHWRTEADKGDSEAALIMAWRYVVGDRTAKDPAAAVRWYRVAADGGNVEAQLVLGHIFSRGDLVEIDHVEAYKWLSLFISSFDTDSFVEERETAIRLRDEIADQMNAGQLDKALSLIEAWEAKR